MKNVGIIGAGASGLCALRHSLSLGLSAQIWEHSNGVGGTWVYTPETGNDAHGYPIHSSMYESLRTNLPREIMGFPSFPFTTGGRSFVKHEEVLRYLNDFVDHFQLRKNIKFGYHVELIEPEDELDSNTKWRIHTKNLSDGSTEVTICDYVFICTGHYSIPNMPNIEGIENFKGSTLHSHNYREPSGYKDLKVAVLGASASGLDLSLETSTVAEKVYLCHNLVEPIPSELPKNIDQVPGIKRATENGFILMDGTVIEADALLYCTGYKYNFPFLSDSTKIEINEDNQVRYLYKHMINSKYPTMCFIGIPFLVCPFIFMDIQVRYCLNVCLGRVTLPNEEAMRRGIQDDLDEMKEKGIPARFFHKMIPLQWKYMEGLIQEAQLKPLPPVVKKISDEIRHQRRLNLTWYKTTNYSIHGSNSYSSPFADLVDVS